MNAIMLDNVTPLILTLNEAPNLERTLAPLAWARDIVVVDSGSRMPKLAFWPVVWIRAHTEANSSVPSCLV